VNELDGAIYTWPEGQGHRHLTQGPRPHTLGSMLRPHLRLVTGLVLVSVLVVAGLLRIASRPPSPVLPSGAIPLALATDPESLLPTRACPAMVMDPARIGVLDDAVVLLAVPSGERMKVVWPAGWAAWRLDGQAQLVSRDGTIVGREGEVLDGLAGHTWDDAFHVCVIEG
jgi:hypothetical protein